jgi:uncharacterized protein YkwD
MFKLLAIATIIFVIFNAFSSLPYNSNEILEAINQARIENNLPVLINSSILENTASQKIDDIERDQNFNHADWNKKIKDKLPAFKFIGENLARNQKDLKTLIKAWLESPLHRQNILDKEFKKSGIAVRKINLDGAEQLIVVQHFSD